MSISFYREESETIQGVKYLPRDDRACELCRLMGKQYIQGEDKMDDVFSFLDSLGISLNFYETKEYRNE